MSIAWIIGYPTFLFATTPADEQTRIAAKRKSYINDTIQVSDLDSTRKYTFPSGRNPTRIQTKQSTWNSRQALTFNDAGKFFQYGMSEANLSILVRFNDPSEGNKLLGMLSEWYTFDGVPAMTNKKPEIAPFILFSDPFCIYNNNKSGCKLDAVRCDGYTSKTGTDPRFCRKVGNYSVGVTDGSGYSRPYRLVYLDYFEEIREANLGDDVREYLLVLVDMSKGQTGARVWDATTNGNTINSTWP